MNPITFNDPFEEILNDLLRMRGFYNHEWVWRTAPLFNYTLTEQRETELAEWRLAHPDFALRLPFETVRLSLRQLADDPERGSYHADFLAAETPENGMLYAVVRVKKMWDETALGRGHFIDFVLTDIDWQSKKPVPEEMGGGKGYLTYYNAMGRFDGKWIQEPMPAMLADCLHQMITGALNVLIAFAIDAMIPGTHVAQVKPDQPQRSVQWIQARTHFTLISHGHPANKREVSHGESVQVNQAAELERMAHARRAHFRTLRSERFRFARGQQVFVKATWIGPKEWRDAGSRQIYRILEPTQQVASSHAAEVSTSTQHGAS